MLGATSTSSVGPVAGKKTKVALKPGRSLMDWIRLGASGKVIQGFGGKQRTVAMKELAEHNTRKDCWMLLRGKVYNVSSYTEYHPGGIDELMRGAGADGTAYFDEAHKWVNIESMLAKCLIGPIEDNYRKPKGNIAAKGPLKPPILAVPSVLSLDQPDTGKVTPRIDWYQNDDHLTISIYTRNARTTREDLIVDCADSKIFNCKVILGDKYYQIHIGLENETSTVKVLEPTSSNGKFEVMLKKTTPGLKWISLGEKFAENDKLLDGNKRELRHRICKICAIKQVTQDTKLFSIQLPERVHYVTPIGHHVLIEKDVQGMKISRNYTVALESLEQGEHFKNEQFDSCLHLMIKIYDDGALTSYLNTVQVGDSISVSDFIGNFKTSRLQNAKSIYMVAAGTGLTPMIRIINYITKDRDTPRKASLLFANRHESDILWRDELDRVAEKHKDILKVDYVLSRPPNDWTGISGRINKQVLEDYFADVKKPNPEEEILICICGSTDFTESVKGYLLAMEFTDCMIHCFLG